MRITGVIQESVVYEDIGIGIDKSEVKHNEESDTIQIGIKKDIMKYRLMYSEVDLLKKLLFVDMNNTKSFDDISDDRIYEIIKKANFLKSVYNYDIKGKDYVFKLLLEQLYSPKSKLGLLNKKENIALVIETIDPKFERYDMYTDLYNVYKEKINKDELDQKDEEIIFQIIEENFGEFTAKLVKMEELYKQRFEKNKNMSLN